MNDLECAVARMFCIGFDGVTITSELKELLRRGVASVILFTRNFESPAQLAQLCYEIKTCASDNPASGEIMICVDQEGGRVQRFREPFTIIPSMREVGRRHDAEFAKRIGRVLAKELRAVNIDMNLAPVLDVDSNPANPVIGERSFSHDPHTVAQLGSALIDGLQSSGLAACAKHFPGHGDTSVDSHLDLPRIAHAMNRLEQIELPPFRAAIAHNVAAIMCAHIMFDAIDSQFPATMSRAVIADLLRDRMKFAGVICSDDLEMKAIIDHFGIEQAVIRGATAGIDLFFICKQHDLQHRALDALIAATKGSEVPRQRIIEANQRIDALFHQYVRPASKWDDRSATLLSAHLPGRG